MDLKSENFFDFLKTIKSVYHFSDFISYDEISFPTEFQIDSFLNVHLFKNVKGLENVDFNDTYNLASIADIKDVNVPFLHINQLIISKKAANRPKDKIDVIALEKIKKLREEEN